jgi:hypothetical protein
MRIQGFRGRPAADLEALEDTLVRVSYLNIDALVVFRGAYTARG